MQAFLANFTYSRRSEAIFAQGREARLRLCEEKEKLATELREVSSRADLSKKMMELANDSFRSFRDCRREHAEEVDKLRGELEKERAARTEAKSEFEVGLAQAKRQQEEAWKALEEQRRLRESLREGSVRGSTRGGEGLESSS